MTTTDDLDNIMKQTNSVWNDYLESKNNFEEFSSRDLSSQEEWPIEWEIIENTDEWNESEKENIDEENENIDEESENVDEENENIGGNPSEENKEENEKNDEDDKNKDIIKKKNKFIGIPINTNPNEKDEHLKKINDKKFKKNSETWEIITDEEIQLEQWQDMPDMENDEEYQPSAEEMFEYEPEFFGDDELSQQFMILVQNARWIFKLERKDWEQNPYFKILWWKNANSTLEYLFYLIEEEDEPIDLYIKKIETNQGTWGEDEHLVQFSYNEDMELNIFVDEVILYEKVNKFDPITPEYNDTKSILEKFIFLTDNRYKKLKAELDKQREERQKKRQLQQIFKGF